MYSTQTKFSGNLHALRGLAAFIIIFYHTKGMNPEMDVGRAGFVNNFEVGVTLFFILSGFSLCLSNYRFIDNAQWLRGYVIKRIARIIPVWYCFITITYIYHYLKYDGLKLGVDGVLFSIIPFFSIVPGREQGMVWAGWTIGVELMFYLIFPIMLVLFRRNWKLWLVALLGLIAISVRTRTYAGMDSISPFIDLTFPRHAFVFVLGCTFYFMTLRAKELGRAPQFVGLMAIISVIGFYGWHVIQTGQWNIRQDNIIIFKTVALGGLTVIAYLSPEIKHLAKINLYNPITRFLGDKSYTLYLAHPIVITQTKPIYKSVYSQVPNPEIAFLIYSFIVIIFTAVIAAIISHFIEEPLYKRGRAAAKMVMAQTSPELNSTAQNDR